METGEYCGTLDLLEALGMKMMVSPVNLRMVTVELVMCKSCHPTMLCHIHTHVTHIIIKPCQISKGLSDEAVFMEKMMMITIILVMIRYIHNGAYRGVKELVDTTVAPSC